jgi:hypothetical protein
MGDHDNIFKRAFSVPAHAAGELVSVLPSALSARLDMSSLLLEPASFIDADMAQHHADLLFSARLAGHHSFVYFLFEHQSAPDDLMPWRVLTYQQRIWAAWLREEPTRKKLPPIITIVVHHGERGWTAPRRFHELVDGLEKLTDLRPYVPDFELVIDDLTTTGDESLHRRPLAAFPKVTLWLLRDGRSMDAFLEHLVAWASELDALVDDDGPGDDYGTVLRYILNVLGEGPGQIVRERLNQLAPRFGEAMPSYDDRLIERGIQQGLQQGLQQAARGALVIVLRGRFGFDASGDPRLAVATVEQLERWLDRASRAERIEDVFAE